MDRRQREVQLELLNHEECIVNRLKENYRAALKEIKKKICRMKEDPAFKEGQARHAKYQMMLEAQLETILHRLGDENVSDMAGYLEDVYREAYLGCLYGMHGDGVDLILRVDEDKIYRCINKETKELKFSGRIYDNVGKLKETVKSEMARGFSTGRDYATIARQVSLRAGASFARMCTIARTEGHRVTSESEMDCMSAAKAKGADVLKEWVSTLDAVTRETHVELDGQARELEEYFVIPSTGAKAMYPGGFGIAGEDINCRCCMNQRARWNLNSEEYRYSRAKGEIVSIKSDVYREWKKLYNKYAEILLENAEGRSYLDNAPNVNKVIKALSKLPPSAQMALLNAKYEFGGNRCYCDLVNRVIRYADNITDKEIYHEMGHLLEKDMFDIKAVREFKRLYTRDVCPADIHIEKFLLSDGVTGKDVILVASDRFIEKYQGRMYVANAGEAFDAEGSLKVDAMMEFLSVPISDYFMVPTELKEKDPVMYEFIRSNIK